MLYVETVICAVKCAVCCVLCICYTDKTVSSVRGIVQYSYLVLFVSGVSFSGF